jgi:2-polyprenyl-3-methyl-5-hydroxy-6-metoxy-1,4-benzoquinol methylase
MERNSYHRIIEAEESLVLDEKNWWAKYAEYENKYSWVQPVEIQKIIRRRYVKQLLTILDKESKILELGCGTGWLLFMLAEAGFKNLTGTDFSKEQLDIAISRKQKSSELVKKRLRFLYTNNEDVEKEKYDVIICHGFLHHLSEKEIFNVIDFAKKQLNSNGKLIVWEPIKYSEGPSKIDKPLNFLLGLFLRFQGSWRKINEEERQLRNFRQTRIQGISPNGPSPMEKPFFKNEIEFYLSAHFNKVSSHKVMAFSQKFAEELLLLKLSHPYIFGLIYKPILKLVVFWEREFLKSKTSNYSSLWIFNMFLFDIKDE